MSQAQKCLLLLAFSLLILSGIFSFAVPIEDSSAESVSTDAYIATFIAGDGTKLFAASEKDNYLGPGVTVTEQGLPDRNTWNFDSYVFMEISIPVFPAEDVLLDPPVAGHNGDYGDWVPVLTFTPSTSWLEVENVIENGSQRKVWMYEKTVAPDETFTPLYTEVSMPNFRVSSGICGKMNYYTDIAPQVEKMMITRYSLQGNLEGTPEQLWKMLK